MVYGSIEKFGGLVILYLHARVTAYDAMHGQWADNDIVYWGSRVFTCLRSIRSRKTLDIYIRHLAVSSQKCVVQCRSSLLLHVWRVFLTCRILLHLYMQALDVHPLHTVESRLRPR